MVEYYEKTIIGAMSWLLCEDSLRLRAGWVRVAHFGPSSAYAGPACWRRVGLLIVGRGSIAAGPSRCSSLAGR